MKKIVKRILKITLITIGSLILLISGVIGLAVWVIFTPERLTPIVNGVAAEYIDGDLTFSGVELTAWSTFPNIAIALTNGTLRNKTLPSGAVTDTIVTFQKLEVVANPVKFIIGNKIDVKRFELFAPQIYAYIDSMGRGNWDIFGTSTDTTASDFKFTAEVALDRLAITRGRVRFDDRATHMYGSVEDLNIDLSGKMEKRSRVDLGVTFVRGIFWMDGDLLAKGVTGEVDLTGEYDPKLSLLSVENTRIKVDNMEIDAHGKVDSNYVDLKIEVLSPDLERVVKLLPGSVVSTAHKMTASGEARIHGSLKGEYRAGKRPKGELTLTVKDGKFAYQGFAYGIDKLDMEVTSHFDFAMKGYSDLVVKSLNVEGTAIKLSLTGRSEDLLGAPVFNAQTRLTVDLTKLAATLPLGKGVHTGGKLGFSGSVRTTLKALSGDFAKKRDWSDIMARGELTLDDVTFRDSLQGLDFSTSSARLKLDHNKIGEASVAGGVGNVKLTGRDGIGGQGNWYANLLSADVELTAAKARGDSVASFTGTLNYKGLNGAMRNDSVKLHSAASAVKFSGNKHSARIRLRTDTLNISTIKNQITLLSTGINARLNNGSISGALSFAHLGIKTPLMPLKIGVDSTTVSVSNDRFHLRRAKIQIGKSDITLTGTIENLLNTKPGAKMVIRGSVTSRNLNINQIIRARAKGQKYYDEVLSARLSGLLPPPEIENQDESSDTTSLLPLMMVSPQLEAHLEARINKLRFGNLRVDNIVGKINVSDGALRCDTLQVGFRGATLGLSTLYKPTSLTAGSSTLNVTAKDVLLSDLRNVLPMLDSLSPMVSCIDGSVSLNLAAHIPMVDYIMPNLATLSAAVDLKARQLIIHDNETFTSIAKMLMFKNKAQTVIDSIEVQAISRKGQVTIFPFSLSADRYRVALGGSQSLITNELNYNVSVLRSPIPFKFGVAITGDFDKFKIGIGKANLKTYFDKQGTLLKTSDEYEELRRTILQHFQTMQ